MQILVIDDEPLARMELTYLIEKSPTLKDKKSKVYQAEDIKEAQGILLKSKIDLMFLDISLNEENGFELAKELRQLSYSPLIVFATAYDNYAVKAFEIGALDYVLKPFEQERIDKALTKALMELTPKEAPVAKDVINDVLSVELKDRNIILRKENLVAVRVSEGILTISTIEKKYKTKKTLSWIKKKLSGPFFVQVHRNAIVNIEQIKEVQPWFNHGLLLVMRNGDRIQVGRAYRKELNTKLGM